MGTVLEEPVKDVVRPLASAGWAGPLMREQWQALGRWLTKVVTLYAHPLARFGDDGLNKNAMKQRPHVGRIPDLTWLTDGSPAPTSLSTVVFRADTSVEETLEEVVIPASVMAADGSTYESFTASLAFPGLHVGVFSHPSMTLRHPLVERGHAWELLRSAPPDGSDLADLPTLSHHAVRVCAGGGVPEGHQIDASTDSRLTGLFGYEDRGALGRPDG
ncbi:hypothetical protein [Aeromicrobium massiliense]|uniref:hypothetical protein n=1 Tax=Aeromicrobium massiliense TaxID=1464554 RepID=UPI0011C8B5BA|nr:hypothetical protein [Aeromicrobium massiliense]